MSSDDIQTEIFEKLPEPYPNLTATIVTAERFESEKYKAKGIRVDLVDGTGNKFSTALWLRDRISEQSKLGSFVKLLGKDPRTWVGKKIIFVEWREKTRVIRVL